MQSVNVVQKSQKLLFSSKVSEDNMSDKGTQPKGEKAPEQPVPENLLDKTEKPAEEVVQNSKLTRLCQICNILLGEETTVEQHINSKCHKKTKNLYSLTSIDDTTCVLSF